MKPLRACLPCLFVLAFVLLPAVAIPSIARGAQLAYVVNEGSANISAINTADSTLSKTTTVGAKPFAIAITPDGKAAYVVNNPSESVSVIDTTTNTVVKTIAIGRDPGAVAITPDGKTAYVTNFGSGVVSAIDTATKTVVSTIPVGTGPITIAITPDGKTAYVANDNPTGNVSAIDTTDNTVASTITVGERPVAVAITPDGKTAYVANLGSKSVSAIDTTDNTVASTITVGERPVAVAISPNGKTAYVANQFSKSISAINTTDNSVKTIPVGEGPSAIAITPDGKTAYVANESLESISAINTTDNSVKTIPVGTHPRAIAVTPDGKTAYVANDDSGDVSAINTATNTVVRTITVGANPGAIAIANVPDGPPLATFLAGAARVRPDVPLDFDASASKDPDSPIASYAWSFGDGGSQSLTTPKATHTFKRPGTYTVLVKETDAEGCSTTPFTFPFAGGNTLCEGNARAQASKQLTIAYPGVKVGCPRSAGHAGCRFSIQAVAKAPRKPCGGLCKGPKSKAESAVGKVKVKAGRSAIVSLLPRKPFATKLATAKSVLVKETVVAGRSRKTRFARLKIVQ